MDDNGHSHAIGISRMPVPGRGLYMKAHFYTKFASTEKREYLFSQAKKCQNFDFAYPLCIKQNTLYVDGCELVRMEKPLHGLVFEVRCKNALRVSSLLHTAVGHVHRRMRGAGEHEG